MKFDFTLKTMELFLEEIISSNFSITTFKEYLENKNDNNKQTIILRHDVDREPEKSLKMAELENSLGINSTYFFRIVPESYNLDIMREISSFGHEIGYHYEDVDLVTSRLNYKNINYDRILELAFESFCSNIEKLRTNFDIKTICMHGSPRSKYDNKIIWNKYNYKDLNIIGEPYFDIDFNKVAYFTDTGRCWNGDRFSIRDKVESSFQFNCKSTFNVIQELANLPGKTMFTIHPERWDDNACSWISGFILQNIKNIIKMGIIRYRTK